MPGSNRSAGSGNRNSMRSPRRLRGARGAEVEWCSGSPAAETWPSPSRLLGNHHSGSLPSLAHVSKERGVRPIAGTDGLEVGFGRAVTEEQHCRVRIASS